MRRWSRAADRGWVALCVLLALWCGGCASAGDTSAGDTSAGDTPVGETSAGDTSAGARSDATAADAETDALGPDGADGAGGALDASGASDAGSPAGCGAWAAATEVGKLTDPRITELSGLARSPTHAGVLWAHNDSGEKTGRLFALNAKAEVVGVLHLPGVTPKDWEDLAAGPCGQAGAALPAGAACLWIGDIGDNGHSAPTHDLLRVPEPLSPPQAGSETTWTEPAPEIFRYRYPDHPTHAALARPDAEALAVLPDGRLLVVTKRDDGRGRLFRVTPAAKQTVTAVPLGLLDLRDADLQAGLSLRATAADLDAAGRFLAVRTYFRAWRFDLAAVLSQPAGAGDALLQAPRVPLPTGFDVQGESLCWDGAGGFWHGSELVGQPLWHVACAAP